MHREQPVLLRAAQSAGLLAGVAEGSLAGHECACRKISQSSAPPLLFGVCGRVVELRSGMGLCLGTTPSAQPTNGGEQELTPRPVSKDDKEDAAEDMDERRPGAVVVGRRRTKRRDTNNSINNEREGGGKIGQCCPPRHQCSLPPCSLLPCSALS